MDKIEEKNNLADTLRMKEEAENENYEGVDLQLSLSLSGQFGVDPEAKKLLPTSSVSGEAVLVESGGSSSQARELNAPVESEEVRKRKEEQTERSLEARKKRLEKRNNTGAAASRVGVKKEKESSSEDCGSNSGDQAANVAVKVESVVVLGGAAQGSSGSSPKANVSVKVEDVVVLAGGQGSIGSSGIIDSLAQKIEVQTTEVRSPPRVHPVQVQAHQEPEGRAPAHASPVADRNGNGKRVAADMPYVSTRYGRRINGFLYRYNAAEEVKIVCVCHGHFLSPAEFVRHGGGGEVENPLRHIVVNPSSF